MSDGCDLKLLGMMTQAGAASSNRFTMSGMGIARTLAFRDSRCVTSIFLHIE